MKPGTGVPRDGSRGAEAAKPGHRYTSTSPTVRRSSATPAVGARTGASSRVAGRGLSRGRRSTSCSATRGSSATASGSQPPIDSRCCSRGTRKIRQRLRAPPKLRDRRTSGQPQPDDRPSGFGRGGSTSLQPGRSRQARLLVNRGVGPVAVLIDPIPRVSLAPGWIEPSLSLQSPGSAHWRFGGGLVVVGLCPGGFDLGERRFNRCPHNLLKSSASPVPRHRPSLTRQSL